ncbi:MAG: RidA family protein [Ardenticatenaceae bacterium]|nr:RidA family protein [Ardenticatenaceae bacterium]
MKRMNISSGAPWESIVGYSRAVRVGPYVHVAGTTAVNGAGELVSADDPYNQTVFILKKIETALQQAGAELTDVVRTRIYVTDVTDWDEVGRAHGEVFGNIRPAATLVEVTSLLEPEMLVEIEADAICAEGTAFS